MNSINHLSIIMDGNGRWANQRGLNRSRGHIAGARRAFEIIRYMSEKNISTLSLFVFSKENWLRPVVEVNTLMRLLSKSLEEKAEFFSELGIRLKVIGDRSGLPLAAIESIVKVEEATSANTGMNLVLAVNYSGQYDICQAIGRMNQKKPSETNANPDDLKNYLLTADMPNPDLIIRTGGECRLSNFFLWQSAYSELHFNDKFWPDFDNGDLERHIDKFFKTQRRFGAIS